MTASVAEDKTHLINNHRCEIFENFVKVPDGADYLQYFLLSLFNHNAVVSNKHLQLRRRKFLQIQRMQMRLRRN